MSPSGLPLACVALVLVLASLAPAAQGRALALGNSRVVAAKGRVLSQTTVPTCDQVDAGVECYGPVTVFGEPSGNRTCIKTVTAAASQCSGSLLNLLAGVLNAESAASSSGTCEAVPCCDDEDGATECLDVELGCLAGLKLCLGGAVGSLLATLLGDSISIVIGPTSPTVSPALPPALPPPAATPAYGSR